MSSNLSDVVAAQIMGEMQELTKNIDIQRTRVEKLAALVVAAAESVEKNKAFLHRQNEAFLMEKVDAITKAIKELKDIEVNMQIAASKQATIMLTPTIDELSRKIKILQDHGVAGGKFVETTIDVLDRANKTQKKTADVIWMAIAGGLLLFSAGFIAAWALSK